MEWEVTLVIRDPLDRSRDYIEGVIDDWLSGEDDDPFAALEWADLFILEKEVEAR